MKVKILAAVLVIFAAFLACSVSAADSDSSGQLSVIDVKISPESFMHNDIGEVTVTVKNSGTTAYKYKRASIYSNDVAILNEESYDSGGTIGAGNTLDFIFSVKASCTDGMKYLWFYLETQDKNSLSYYIPLQVESSGLVISASDAPEYYQKGISEKITLNIGNPRINGVSGVTVSLDGDATTTQGSQFVGKIDSDGTGKVVFEVTPQNEGSMTFVVSYRNGINQHSSELTLPIAFGEDKKGISIVVNNVEVSGMGSNTKISGDISNAGLEDAKSVIVTVDSPAVPVDPYKEYVVGSVDSDDFSSFELTCKPGEGTDEIPLLVTYKDSVGNSFKKYCYVDTAKFEITDAGSKTTFQQGMGRGMGMRGGFLPITEIVIFLILVVGFCYAWKKGWVSSAVSEVRKRLKKN